MLRLLHPKYFSTFTSFTAFPLSETRSLMLITTIKKEIIPELTSPQSFLKHMLVLYTDSKCQLDFCVSHLSRKLPSAPAATRIFLKETCWGHSDSLGSYLRIRDLTEHRGQALKQQHCLHDMQQMGWACRLVSAHCVPLFLLSFFLPCHTQATAVLCD